MLSDFFLEKEWIRKNEVGKCEPKLMKFFLFNTAWKTFQLRSVLSNLNGRFLTSDFLTINFPTSRFSICPFQTFCPVTYSDGWHCTYGICKLIKQIKSIFYANFYVSPITVSNFLAVRVPGFPSVRLNFPRHKNFCPEILFWSQKKCRN